MFFSFTIFSVEVCTSPPIARGLAPKWDPKRTTRSLFFLLETDGFPTATKKQQIANVILSWHEQTQTTKYWIPFPYSQGFGIPICMCRLNKQSFLPKGIVEAHTNKSTRQGVLHCSLTWATHLICLVFFAAHLTIQTASLPCHPWNEQRWRTFSKKDDQSQKERSMNPNGAFPLASRNGRFWRHNVHPNRHGKPWGFKPQNIAEKKSPCANVVSCQNIKNIQNHKQDTNPCFFCFPITYQPKQDQQKHKVVWGSVTRHAPDCQQKHLPMAKKNSRTPKIPKFCPPRHVQSWHIGSIGGQIFTLM